MKKLQLAIDLLRLEYKDLSNISLISKLKEEFNIDCTEQDINAIQASYLPDNFEAESKKIEYYGRFNID